MLDLDELLQKIPQLIARHHEVSGVRRVPARSERQRAVDRLLRRLSGRRRAHAARCKSAKAWSARRSPRASRFSSTTSTPIRATSKRCPAPNAELVVPLRRKGRVIGALNLLERHHRPVHRQSTRRCSASSARTSPSRSRTRGCSSTSANATSTLETALRDRARVRRDSESRRAAHAHREPHPARDRLPHVRHPARQRARPASSR